MQRFITAVLSAVLLLVLAIPATAHEDGEAGLFQPARRDHFVEHLLVATLTLDAGNGDHIQDANHDADNGEGCFTDLGAVRAQTDLNSDGDTDHEDDTFLRKAICDGKVHGAVRGKTDGSFDPTGATRRDQGASFVCRSVALLDGPGELEMDGDDGCDDQRDTQYPDVKNANVHSGAVFALSNGGGDFDPPIFQGFTDGKFKPAESVKNRHAQLVADRIVDNFGEPTDD